MGKKNSKASSDPTTEPQAILSPEAARRMLGEMVQQQTQLEMLNEELRRAHAAVEASQVRYFDFYNVAPVGYLTITTKGLILDANLTIASLLGVARESLIRQTLSSFIPSEDQDSYHSHIKQLFAAGAAGACEFRLISRSRGEFWVRMESILVRGAEDASLCHAVLSDITERKTAEDTLRESEARIRAITRSVQDAVLIMNPMGLISYWNPAAARIFGYTEEEAIGKNLHRFLSPLRYHEAHREAFARFQQNGTGKAVEKTVELEACHKDGHEISVELSLSAIRLPDGWHSAGIVRDITARKIAEEAVRSSRARYHALVDQSCEALTLVDIQKQEIVEMNSRFTELLGYSLPEDAPLYANQFVVEPQSDTDRRYKTTLPKQRYLPPETVLYRHKNGAEIPIERVGTVVTIDGKDWVLFSNRDMTERKLMEAKLRESEERFRKLSENARDMIYRMSLPDGRYEYVSPASIQLTGHTPEEICSGRVHLSNMIHPESEEYFKKQWSLLLLGEIPDTYEYKIIHKDGSARWLFQKNVAVRNANDSPIAIEAIVSDITERKLLEEELRLQATTDGLTGIFNRRHFLTRTEEELQRIGRYGGKCTLLMVDIDHFKRVNDRLGHAAGDVVLQHVALLCRKATRTTDLLGRVGGEEFAILLLEAGGLEAKLVAERLRQSIENNLFETEEGAQVSLQVSIGVAEYQIRKDSLSDLMIRADKALYRAKNEGRNRVAELE